MRGKGCVAKGEGRGVRVAGMDHLGRRVEVPADHHWGRAVRGAVLTVGLARRARRVYHRGGLILELAGAAHAAGVCPATRLLEVPNLELAWKGLHLTSVTPILKTVVSACLDLVFFLSVLQSDTLKRTLSEFYAVKIILR